MRAHTITTTMAALLLSLLALGALGLVACRGGDDDEATAGFETETPDSTEVRLSPEQKIEQTGNKWAPAFAAGSHFARMTQPALERITCKRIGGPKRTCTPPPSALRRSFQHATVQDTAIKGDKAAARFSNGETIELVHVSGRGWLIHRIGGNAGDEEFITKVGEEWAARFAKDDSAACHLMFAQPLCEEFFGSPGDAPSEPPTVGRPSGFQRSFANATLERVAITGIKAEAAFSNGELVEFIQETDEPRRALGSWFILDVGENASAVLSGSGYRAQANEICRSGESEITQATRETFGFGTGSQGEVREFVTNTVMPNIQSQIDELRALTPPEDQAEEFEGWLDHAQAGLDELETDPVAGFTQPAANPFADVNREAAELGIDEC